MKYVIGIDGGGTKSRILAVDLNRNILGSGMGGSTNLASNPKEDVFQSLKNTVVDLLNKTGLKLSDCLSLCIGSAGLDSNFLIESMKEIIITIGINCPIIVVNDSLLVLEAALGGKQGIVIISGTGSIAYGKDEKGNTIRCGGWGHILDDVGSAYWIAKEAFRCSMRYYDGRGEKTLLEEKLKSAMNITDMSECIQKVYNEFNKSDLAAFPVYVDECAVLKDNVSLDIIKRAANELYLLTDTVLKKLKINTKEIFVSGGTIMNSNVLFGNFCDIIEKKIPAVEVKKINKKPVMGAVDLALKGVLYQ